MTHAPPVKPPVVLGLDLAWSPRNPSGAVEVAAHGGAWHVATPLTLHGDGEILAWVDGHATHGPVLLAIDAPIIAPNPAGTGRECDREVSRQFGRFHAGAYPGNRARCARPVALAQALVARGFSLDPDDVAAGAPRGARGARGVSPDSLDITAGAPQGAPGAGHVALEVYPHAASIALLRLERIVKYKKGRVTQRRAGLTRLQSLIFEHLPQHDPPLALGFPGEDPEALRGRALKALEDRLDAVLCAAMAVIWCTHRTRCRVIGDVASGYVLVPRLDG